MKCIKYSNVVVNLIGRDWETKNFTYNDVHVEGAGRLAKLCKQSGVERFIHFSCLNAHPNPEVFIMLSNLQTKGQLFKLFSNIQATSIGKRLPILQSQMGR